MVPVWYFDSKFKVPKQIVVSDKNRSDVLEIAQVLPMSGNLSINKADDRILQHFIGQS